MRVFLITGASIGIVGTIAGLILRLVFTIMIGRRCKTSSHGFWARICGIRTVRFLSDIPAEIDPSEVIAVLGHGLCALGFWRRCYPSWRAARA